MLKLNVGLSKKVGEPNYGSRGASAHLELELDSQLAFDPERLRERIRQLYQLARGAIEEELAGRGEPPTAGGNGHLPEGGANGAAPRPATDSQVRALYALARQQDVDLGALLLDRCGCWDPAELSLVEASALIDELKNSRNGSRR